MTWITIKSLFATGTAKTALVVSGVVMVQMAVIVAVQLQSSHPQPVTGAEIAVTVEPGAESERAAGIDVPVTPVVGDAESTATVLEPGVRIGSAVSAEPAGEPQPDGAAGVAPVRPPDSLIETLLTDILVPQDYGTRTPYIPR